jgi:hypothetical protein
MPDVHLPQLEDHEDHPAPAPHAKKTRPFARLLLEVVLISGGVFLGIAGEQWREASAHREMARAAVERFRSEIVANQKAINDIRDYHVHIAAVIKQALAANTEAAFEAARKQIHGIHVINFQHTAWDVALATQSLAYIDSDLVFSLSDVYNRQAQLRELSGYLIESEFSQPPAEGQTFAPFLKKTDVYFDDALPAEADMLKAYDIVLPKLDHVLGKN